MNVQLVESLVVVIESLSLEEKALLKAQLSKGEKSCDELFKKINASIEQDKFFRGGKPLSLSIPEMIHQIREERDKQILGSHQTSSSLLI